MTLILSLDDEETVLHLLGVVIELAGYEHVRLNDDDEAIALMRSRQVDLLTQDILRPGMGGVEFYHMMKADETLRHIPVLFISGGTRPEFAAACRRMYKDEYIVKPWTPAELVATMAACLTRHGRRPPTDKDRAARYETVKAQYVPRVKTDQEFDEMWHSAGKWLERT